MNKRLLELKFQTNATLGVRTGWVLGVLVLAAIVRLVAMNLVVRATRDRMDPT